MLEVVRHPEFEEGHAGAQYLHPLFLELHIPGHTILESVHIRGTEPDVADEDEAAGCKRRDESALLDVLDEVGGDEGLVQFKHVWILLKLAVKFGAVIKQERCIREHV